MPKLVHVDCDLPEQESSTHCRYVVDVDVQGYLNVEEDRLYGFPTSSPSCINHVAANVQAMPGMFPMKIGLKDPIEPRLTNSDLTTTKPGIYCMSIFVSI